MSFISKKDIGNVVIDRNGCAVEVVLDTEGKRCCEECVYNTHFAQCAPVQGDNGEVGCAVLKCHFEYKDIPEGPEPIQAIYKAFKRLSYPGKVKTLKFLSEAAEEDRKKIS